VGTVSCPLLILCSVSEHDTILTVLNKQFSDVAVAHKLSRYFAGKRDQHACSYTFLEGVENLVCLVKLEHRPANQPAYVQLDVKQTIRQSLAGLTIVEYPEIVVLASYELHGYVIEAKPANVQETAPVKNEE
jgi:hypothetical protein